MISEAWVYWFAGLVDGEGHFGIDNKGKPEFVVGLRGDDEKIISEIKEVLGFGNVATNSMQSIRNRGLGAQDTIRYKASGGPACYKIFLLLDGKLRTKKANDLAIWGEAVSASVLVNDGKAHPTRRPMMLEYRDKLKKVRDMSSTNTKTLAEVQRAKSNLADAEAALLSVVKQGIKDGLIEAFENSNVQNVAFGVSTQPYNDENMGCGTYGPVANGLGEDGEVSEYHALYELFGYRSDSGGSTGEVRLLHDVIEAASWENVGPALGLSTAEDESYGGQEVLFVAERSDSAPGGYLLTQHDQER